MADTFKREKGPEDCSLSRVLRSEELFGHAKLVIIQHRDNFYRLMITRQGKLILTK